MILLGLLLLAYLLGSIPFGLLLTRAAGLGDIRAIGSGNIGATNVLRTGNKKLAALVLLLDGLKGYAAFYMVAYFLTYGLPAGVTTEAGNAGWVLILIVPIVTVLGHIFPIWLKFKGGKGVATAFGVVLALLPRIGIAGLLTWLCIFGLTRISSLSALIAMLAMALMTFLFYGIIFFIPVFIIAMLVVGRHKDNIRRLLAGTEPRFGKKAP